MSRAPESQADGFSLVEIIVAMGVLMVVMVALLPQLVLGIQATGTAQLSTQAKGVAQGELEKMRNLPYYISPEAGPFLDVLDTYYRNATTAPSTAPTCPPTGGLVMPQVGWSGFVAGSAARCAYEPTTGAFYREVKAGAQFSMVIDTQFLSEVTPAAGTAPQPVTPASTYNSQPSQNISHSQPASRQIGVTVTVLYRDRDTVRSVSTYTQIADRPVADVRVRVEANVTTLEVGSETLQDAPLSLTAGILDLAGSLNFTSTVHATLSATSASLATGAQDSGATASLVAPPSSTAESLTDNGGGLGTTGCGLVCWGGTQVDVERISASNGLPLAGTQPKPMQALVTDKNSHDGMSFDNSIPTEYRADLQLKPPLLRLHSTSVPAASGITATCAPGGSATLKPAYVTAGGYLLTTSATDAVRPSTVESCAVAHTSTISLFPTDFATDGVVVVELTRASARCTVAGPTHLATTSHDYSAVVKYWNGSAYQAVATIVPGMASDPLEGVDLTTSVGGGHQLGDYIASWSALMTSEVTATATNGVAEVTLPGVVTIASQPVRPDPIVSGTLDAASTVSVAIGALGCHAEDKR